MAEPTDYASPNRPLDYATKDKARYLSEYKSNKELQGEGYAGSTAARSIKGLAITEHLGQMQADEAAAARALTPEQIRQGAFEQVKQRLEIDGVWGRLPPEGVAKILDARIAQMMSAQTQAEGDVRKGTAKVEAVREMRQRGGGTDPMHAQALADQRFAHKMDFPYNLTPGQGVEEVRRKTGEMVTESDPRVQEIIKKPWYGAPSRKGFTFWNGYGGGATNFVMKGLHGAAAGDRVNAQYFITGRLEDLEKGLASEPLPPYQGTAEELRAKSGAKDPESDNPIRQGMWKALKYGKHLGAGAAGIPSMAAEYFAEEVPREIKELAQTDIAPDRARVFGLPLPGAIKQVGEALPERTGKGRLSIPGSGVDMLMHMAGDSETRKKAAKAATQDTFGEGGITEFISRMRKRYWDHSLTEAKRVLGEGASEEEIKRSTHTIFNELVEGDLMAMPMKHPILAQIIPESILSPWNAVSPVGIARAGAKLGMKSQNISKAMHALQKAGDYFTSWARFMSHADDVKNAKLAQAAKGKKVADTVSYTTEDGVKLFDNVKVADPEDVHLAIEGSHLSNNQARSIVAGTVNANFSDMEKVKKGTERKILFYLTHGERPTQQFSWYDEYVKVMADPKANARIVAGLDAHHELVAAVEKGKLESNLARRWRDVEMPVEIELADAAGGLPPRTVETMMPQPVLQPGEEMLRKGWAPRRELTKEARDAARLGELDEEVMRGAGGGNFRTSLRPDATKMRSPKTQRAIDNDPEILEKLWIADPVEQWASELKQLLKPLTAAEELQNLREMGRQLGFWMEFPRHGARGEIMEENLPQILRMLDEERGYKHALIGPKLSKEATAGPGAVELAETVQRITSPTGAIKGDRYIIVPEAVEKQMRMALPFISGEDPLSEAARGFLKFMNHSFGPLNKIARYIATVPNNMFAAVNMTGAGGLGLIAAPTKAMNPGLQYSTMKAVLLGAMEGNEAARGTKTMINGVEMTYGQIVDMMKADGVMGQFERRLGQGAFQGYEADETGKLMKGLSESFGSAITDKTGKIRNPVKWAQQQIEKVGESATPLLGGMPVPIPGLKDSKIGKVISYGSLSRLTEDYQHALVYLSFLEGTDKMSRFKALRSMRKYASDYRALTEIERKGLNEVFMFYNWTKFILGRGLRMFWEHPARALNMQRLREGWNQSQAHQNPWWQEGTARRYQAFGLTAPARLQINPTVNEWIDRHGFTLTEKGIQGFPAYDSDEYSIMMTEDPLTLSFTALNMLLNSGQFRIKGDETIYDLVGPAGETLLQAATQMSKQGASGEGSAMAVAKAPYRVMRNNRVVRTMENMYHLYKDAGFLPKAQEMKMRTQMWRDFGMMAHLHEELINDPHGYGREFTMADIASPFQKVYYQQGNRNVADLSKSARDAVKPRARVLGEKDPGEY